MADAHPPLMVAQSRHEPRLPQPAVHCMGSPLFPLEVGVPKMRRNMARRSGCLNVRQGGSRS